MQPVFRYAPTPSGFLHQGNIFNFILIWLLAKTRGAKILLRIDDLDADRSRPDYVSDIFRVLEKLGLHWDLGPAGPDDFYKNWSQQKRRDLYEKYVVQLKASEALFACDCSRKKLEGKTLYPGTCEHKQLDMDARDVAWRIRLSNTALVGFEDASLGKLSVDLGKETGSFVVRRRDKIPSYQIASLADDLHFGITDIVRGKDLLLSTAMQLFLAQNLRNPMFAATRFYHHPLLFYRDGSKISKSAGWLKTPMKINHSVYSEFAEWMGWHGGTYASLEDLYTVALSNFANH